MGYFDENNKLFGLNGVIGRRNFIVNCLIIEIIESVVFLTPFIYSMFFSSEMRAVAVGDIKPLWFMIVQCLLALISTALYFPSVVRRVRDIIGEEDDNRIFLVSSVIAVVIFMGYTPVATSFFGGWILLFTLFSLIFMAGKITGQKPKNEIVKFNWGAFFGTWIWGLLNRVPKTLVILPLFFTFAWVPFMVICGLKGNEWAYKNQNKDSQLIEFHQRQQVQSVVLGILTPVLFLVLSLVFFVVTIFSLSLYVDKHPYFKDKMMLHVKNLQIDSAESGFERIELKDGVYCFYVDPEDWVEVTRPIFKQAVINSAANYVLLKNGKSTVGLKDRLAAVDLLNKIKIYSTYNDEVLGEFYMDPKQAKEYLLNIDNPDAFQEIKREYLKSYKFNNNPSLP